MGWTFTSRPKGTPIKTFLKERVFGPNFEILECAVVKRTTAYVAARNLETGKVFACVFLLAYRPNDRGFEFGYKDMTEDCGPNAIECPERVLDLLTPTESKWALEWRAKCRERLATKKAVPKVKPGDVIRFATPIRFRDGSVRDTFRLKSRGRNGRGRYFEAVGFVGWSNSFTITGWRERPFEVLERAAAA